MCHSNQTRPAIILRMIEPFSMLTGRLRGLAASAAKTDDWVIKNVEPIPELHGVSIEVTDPDTVVVSKLDRPIGTLILADDDQSFGVWVTVADGDGETDVLVADQRPTMPNAILALTGWLETEERNAAAAAAQPESEPTDEQEA